MKSLQDIKDALKTAEQDLDLIKSFLAKHKVEEQIQALSEKASTPNFWQAPEFIATNKKLAELKEKQELFWQAQKNFSQVLELVEMFGESVDPQEIENLIIEVKSFCKDLSKLKINFLLNKKFDANNCFVNINPGAGGTESQDWAEMLLRMYLRFAELHNFSATILDQQQATEAGIKSVTMLIKGKNAYGLLRGESGIHRLVRISPFDSNKRRHTSFAAVAVSPEVEEGLVEIKPTELRIDTYRSGGAGGQHVNTTDSAVRITHIPTGIVAQCQNERSQHQNKQQAMKILYSRIVEFQEQKKQAEIDSNSKQKIEWGSQIRSYVLHPYKMVKDHRTDFESPVPEDILDGNLDQFIEHYLLL